MLTAVRSALFLLAQTILTVAFSILAPFLFLLPRLVRWRVMACWNRSILLSLRLTCGVRHALAGKELLPDPPYVLYSKHQSAWETIAFCCLFPPVAFVAKRELLWIPCFGWGLATMSPITIDRSSKRAALRAVVAGGNERIRQGFSVCIFPEGSRIAPGKTAKFAASGAKLAAEANVPLVPVAINSGRCWPHKSWLKHPGEIAVSIGKPIQPTRETVRQSVEQLHQWISSETRKLEARA